METWALFIALSQPLIIDGFDSYEACRSYGATQETCNRPETSFLNVCWSPHFSCIRRPAGSVLTVGPQSKAIIVSRSPVE